MAKPPNTVSATAATTDAQATTSGNKAVVLGSAYTAFQAPATKGQKNDTRDSGKMSREVGKTAYFMNDNEELLTQAFDLQSLSQSSEEGGNVGNAAKKRKYSVIKDPINLRALY